jgi:hypothetical protein
LLAAGLGEPVKEVGHEGEGLGDRV